MGIGNRDKVGDKIATSQILSYFEPKYEVEKFHPIEQKAKTKIETLLFQCDVGCRKKKKSVPFLFVKQLNEI